MAAVPDGHRPAWCSAGPPNGPSRAGTETNMAYLRSMNMYEGRHLEAKTRLAGGAYGEGERSEDGNGRGEARGAQERNAGFGNFRRGGGRWRPRIWGQNSPGNARPRSTRGQNLASRPRTSGAGGGIGPLGAAAIWAASWTSRCPGEGRYGWRGAVNYCPGAAHRCPPRPTGGGRAVPRWRAGRDLMAPTGQGVTRAFFFAMAGPMRVRQVGGGAPGLATSRRPRQRELASPSGPRSTLLRPGDGPRDPRRRSSAAEDSEDRYRGSDGGSGGIG